MNVANKQTKLIIPDSVFVRLLQEHEVEFEDSTIGRTFNLKLNDEKLNAGSLNDGVDITVIEGDIATYATGFYKLELEEDSNYANVGSSQLFQHLYSAPHHDEPTVYAGEANPRNIK